jgi:hypothetical protein
MSQELGGAPIRQVRETINGRAKNSARPDRELHLKLIRAGLEAEMLARHALKLVRISVVFISGR